MNKSTLAPLLPLSLLLLLLLLSLLSLLLVTPTLAAFVPDTTCSAESIESSYTLGCTIVLGDLHVSDENEFDRDSFATIKIITGNLIIYSYYTSDLPSYFSSLKEVGGSLNFYGRGSSTDIHIPSLQRVNGTFSILSESYELINCDDFPSLVYLGGLEIDTSSSSGCSSANPYSSNLTEIAGSVSIKTPFHVSESSFNLLSNIVSINGDLIILDEMHIYTPYNFTKLKTIKGTLKFYAHISQLNFFSNLTEVNTLDISSYYITSISFPKLETVTSTFRLFNCDGLTSVSFPKLTRVGTIKDHTTDNSPRFIIQGSGLNITQQFKNITVVNGDAHIFNNQFSCLRHNSPVVTVASGKYLFFNNEDCLTSCNTFGTYSTVTQLNTLANCDVLLGDFIFQPSAGLSFSTFPSIPRLREIHGHLIVRDTTLTISNFNIFPNLAYVSGFVVFTNNTKLVSLTGLPLVVIGDGLLVSSNPALTNLNITKGIYSCGLYPASSLESLPNSGALYEVQHITYFDGKNFIVRNNPLLTALYAAPFNKLESALLYIAGNINLCSMSFFQSLEQTSVSSCDTCEYSYERLPEFYLGCRELNHYIDEPLEIDAATAQYFVTVQKISSYYTITIKGLAAFQKMSGLVEVVGSLKLTSDDVIRSSISLFPNLKKVLGIFSFSELVIEGDVTGLSQLTIVESVELRQLNVTGSFNVMNNLATPLMPLGRKRRTSLYFTFTVESSNFGTFGGFLNARDFSLGISDTTMTTMTAFQNSTAMRSIYLQAPPKFSFPKLKVVSQEITIHDFAHNISFPALINCSVIDISDCSSQAISFPLLNFVGDISIVNCKSLKRINGFPSLRQIYNSFIADGLENLESIDLPAVTQIGAVRIRNSFFNPSSSNVYVSMNRLHTIEDFPGSYSYFGFSGALNVFNTSSLKYLLFQALETVSLGETDCDETKICLKENSQLVSLGGFPSLSSDLSDNIILQNNPELCPGFPVNLGLAYSKANCNEDCNLPVPNVVVTLFDFVKLVGRRVVGDLRFSPNFDPAGFFTFPDLDATGNVYVIDSPFLKDLRILSSIENWKSLIVSGNLKLESFAGINQEYDGTLSYLVVENNPKLRTLDHLPTIELDGSSGLYNNNFSISIRNNPSLFSLTKPLTTGITEYPAGSYLDFRNNGMICVDHIPAALFATHGPKVLADSCTIQTQINRLSASIETNDTAVEVLNSLQAVSHSMATGGTSTSLAAESILLGCTNLANFATSLGSLPDGVKLSNLTEAFNDMLAPLSVNQLAGTSNPDWLPAAVENLLQLAGKDQVSCGAVAFEKDLDNMYAKSFQADSSGSSDLTFEIEGAEMSIPASMASAIGFNSTGTETSCMSQLFVMFKNNPFPVSPKFGSKSISPIMSFSIFNTMILNLDEPITFTVPITPGVDVSKAVCSFYNYTISEWDTRGCNMTTRSSSSISCSCDHATNFGVLLDLNDNLSEESKQALNYLSAIGCGLSLTGSLLTLIAFALLPKLRTGPVNLVLGLCVAIFFVNLLFLIGMSESSNLSADGCEAVAILLHMFLLISFMIMFCQALHMYLLVVRLSREKDHLIKYYLIVSFVLPIVFVICLVIANAAMKPYRVVDYGGLDSSVGHSCWIGNTNGLLGAFAIPVAVVLVFNLIIFILVLRTFRQIRNDKALVDAKEKKTDTKLYLTVMTLFGLTWIFGYIGYIRGAEFAWYLFVIFNSFQGFFIFIFYCLNPRVIDGIRERVFNLPPKYSLIGSARTSNATSAGTLSRSSKTTPMHSVSDEEKGASSAYSSTFDSQDMEMKETKK